MKKIATYKNGNVYTTIYDDGTKIHFSRDDEFRFKFPESMDISISQKCDNGCPWCYYGCSPTGEYGKLKNWKFFDSMRPYTEIAINLQKPIHPDIVDFLYEMKKRNIIVNATINQNHFMDNIVREFIGESIGRNLIKGLGVSLVNPIQDGFIEEVKKYPNAVIHVIAGITHPEDIGYLMNKGLKILFLGYKEKERGKEYIKSFDNMLTISDNWKWIESGLDEIINGFEVVSFDNLALEQLNIKKHITKDQWDLFYAGEDGTSTFALDLVHGTFARSSISEIVYPIGERSIDEMFEIIREEK